MVDVRKLIIFLKIPKMRKKKTTKLNQSHTTPNLSGFLNMKYVHWRRQPRENSLSKCEYKRVTGRENYSNPKLQCTQFSLLPKRKIITKKKRKNSLPFGSLDCFCTHFRSKQEASFIRALSRQKGYYYKPV
jgi:hypothetical protein